ncbi:lytic murein transglycosylase [Streptomyces yunnanensis]|uniref:Lytic murein transglycosylase n=1 Tax=Streptomyces yunnanensis TaxID=156453 RepID=A0ABY8A3D4_9ACTN|nr:lytic murein transglycosylase [Streptomyces yunnanensis]WEB39199.1 lytic murein transglycosylase [Streptomyces yunnanensis]
MESVHASGYGLRTDGSTEKPIRGPRLDGHGFALIRDTDGGRWDGDTEFDRAVGPTQFIPSTWQTWGADGNGDGNKDPNNIYDAALGTAHYLCAGDRDLRHSADLDRAILSYNNSRAYVNVVLEWMRTYQGGTVTGIPDDSPATPHRPDPAAPSTSLPSRRVALKAGPLPLADRPGTSSRPTPTPTSPAKPRPETTPQPETKPTPGTETAPGTKPTPRPTPQPHSATALHRLGAATLETAAGTDPDRQLQVRATDTHGAPVPGAKVTYEIGGAEGAATAQFPHNARRVAVTANREGIAAAPRLRVGDIPGLVTVRAILHGSATIRAVAFTITIRPVPADALTLLAGPLPETAAGRPFAGPVRIRATAQGKPVAGTRLTATLLTGTEQPGDHTGPIENHQGPYFTTKQDEHDGQNKQGENGEPVQALTLPATGPNGIATLPRLHAGLRTGTYTLRVTTGEGTTLDIPVTVTATNPKH